MPISYQNTGPVDCAVTTDLEKLKGKSVIVTGGSSGLGAAYVAAFLKAGSFVTNADIQPRNFESGNYQYVKCDVCSWTDQLAVFKAAITLSPNQRIDIVIANAAVVGDDPFMTTEDTDEPAEPDFRILNIGLIGTAYTTKLALHYFGKSEASDKCLILKASIAGYFDLPGGISYQTVKFGVRGLMRSLRHTGLCRVNVIAPWFINTPILTAPVREFLSAKLAEGGYEWATPEDSAKAVLRVAADESINGRALAILPTSMKKDGFMDFELDDFKAGTELGEWQDFCISLTSRRPAPSEET